ncbi:MAG: hypothetical protein K0S00_442 [Xanthobacteraceae bacterium]|jgi:hypothetical protein|nr:hypothetical protein [Xanthobacteraceae bacterium]
MFLGYASSRTAGGRSGIASRLAIPALRYASAGMTAEADDIEQEGIAPCPAGPASGIVRPPERSSGNRNWGGLARSQRSPECPSKTPVRILSKPATTSS